MLRRHLEFYFQFLQIVDAFLLCVSLWAAHTIRYHLVRVVPFFALGSVAPFSNYFWMFYLMLPLGPIILDRQGFYRFSTNTSLGESLLAIARSVLIILLAIVVSMVAFRVPQDAVSRAALILFFPVAVLFLGFREVLLRMWLRGQGRSRVKQQHLMLCGSKPDRDAWKAELAALPGKKFLVSEELDLHETTQGQFVQRLHEGTIDVAVFSIDHTSVAIVRQALLSCEAEGIEAWVSADFFRTALAKLQFDRFAGRPLLVFRSTPDASLDLMLKRAIDVIVSLVLLTVLSPLLLLIALIILVTMGQPIIFKQLRNGLYGRPFVMYKFRTMASNAEQVRAELRAYNLMSGPVFKVEHDPRVTPFGRWLRHSSLDELPQLWNVFKSEMSLVGPRPLPVYETENFDDFSQRRRMSVRPGLTCLWQISGRNEITNFDNWVKLDLKYIDEWSLGLDFKIMLLTIPVVLFRRGAK
jgi:exopolysaccharide biosynthesis polyprenyl glycosylphosphotransferase